MSVTQRTATSAVPLAERMRPTTLDAFVGQGKLIGTGTFLRRAIEEDRVPSMVLWGPPGSGKTTLARIVAHTTHADFVQLSATGSGLKELRDVIARASELQRLGGKTVLFVDEIHRWNKSQQDTLLPSVEAGTVTFIGATTENPSFEVNAALVSRARVFVLEQLGVEAITLLLRRALTDIEHGFGNLSITVPDDVITFIAHMANGDARMALNTLEAAVNFSLSSKESLPLLQRGSGRGWDTTHAEEAREGKHIVTIDLVKEVLQKSHLLYDKTGEEHYNVISALHKSMRGGDANASVYWLARMLEGGEDPLYVARRLVRFASEDIGLANATALLLANATYDACHKLGMPECSVHLAQLVIYLAKSPKSIVAYDAYTRAKRDVEAHGNLPIPLHLRNAPTKLMKDLQHGKGYKYPPKQDSSTQTYLPPELEGRTYVQ